MNDYLEFKTLAHQGIKGQKWGVKNGPPYPLNYEDHTAEQKRLNPKGILGTLSENKKDEKGDAKVYRSQKKAAREEFKSDKKANEPTAREEYKKSKEKIAENYRLQKISANQLAAARNAKVKTSSILATGFGGLGITAVGAALMLHGAKKSNEGLMLIGKIAMSAGFLGMTATAAASDIKKNGQVGINSTKSSVREFYRNNSN